MIRALAACLAAVLAAGCGTAPPAFNMSTSDFSKAAADDLCTTYGFRSDRALEARAELVRRNLFSPAEWQQIDDKLVVAGMTECAVKAAVPLGLGERTPRKGVAGEDIGSDVVLRCAVAPVLCPYVRIEFRQGKVARVAPGPMYR